jgi:hypothetical protein
MQQTVHDECTSSSRNTIFVSWLRRTLPLVLFKRINLVCKDTIQAATLERGEPTGVDC